MLAQWTARPVECRAEAGREISTAEKRNPGRLHLKLLVSCWRQWSRDAVQYPVQQLRSHWPISESQEVNFLYTPTSQYLLSRHCAAAKLSARSKRQGSEFREQTLSGWPLWSISERPRDVLAGASPGLICCSCVLAAGDKLSGHTGERGKRGQMPMLGGS